MKDKGILILGLGNDLLGDDAVGLVAARKLKSEFEDVAVVAEASAGGLEIMELLEGYEKVLILDAIVTGRHEPGTILELSSEEFRKTVAIAPHYVTLPEAIELAEQLKIKFPKEIKILAVEITDPFSLREGLSPAIRGVISSYTERAGRIIAGWLRKR